MAFIAAVQQRNTPAIFDWLADALSYQSVSDSIAYTYSDWHANINPNCHGNCESDSDSQTNPQSETPCDSEAAATSGAKAGRSVTGLFAACRHPERRTAKLKDPVSLPRRAAHGISRLRSE